jgi:hypothetical protein
MAGTAGCLWEEETRYKLALVGVGNYLYRSHRLEVQVAKDGENVTTTEVELGPGTNGDPTAGRIECAWSAEPGRFTIDVRHLGEPEASESVSLPGDRSKGKDLGTCVGVTFYIGSRFGGYIRPTILDCEEYRDEVSLCVGEE